MFNQRTFTRQKTGKKLIFFSKFHKVHFVPSKITKEAKWKQ